MTRSGSGVAPNGRLHVALHVHGGGFWRLRCDALERDRSGRARV